MSDKLRFNTEKHDSFVDAIKQSAADDARKAAMQIIEREYKSMKRALVKEPKTQQEVVAWLYLLHDRVGNICKHTPGMAEWRAFTMGMIEDKIAQVIATDCGAKNQITEYLPDSAANNPQALTLPESAVFGTVEELMAVKFVVPWLTKELFVGLCREGKWIWALFADGEVLRVGVCITEVGIQKLPTIEQLRKALADQQEGAKE